MGLLKFLLASALVFLEVGCGLPFPYNLGPPAVSSGFLLATLQCKLVNSQRGLDSADVSFQGFELYYKFYGSPTDPNLLPDTQYGTGNYSVSDLLYRFGFHRVTLGPGTAGLTADTTPDGGVPPLINIKTIDPSDLSTSLTVTLNFADTAPTSWPDPTPISDFSYTPLTGTYANTLIFQEIRRHVQANPLSNLNGTCKAFANNTAYQYDYDPAGADPDVGTQIANNSQLNNGGNLVVMMYAASYGSSPAGPLYSYPVYLGYCQINAFN